MTIQEAVILSRISDAKQEDGYSLDAQERFALDYCEKKNFTVVKKFRLVETGSKVGKRQKFDSMMEFLKGHLDKMRSKQPLCLIVEKPDRLTRNFTNREQIQFFVMMGKLEIHYYKDKRIVDQNCSPADIFTDDMMTSVSKYVALNIAREVKKGLNEKAKNGWYPAHPPIGYKYVRDGQVGKHGRREARIVVDPDRKNIVYRMFELRAVEKLSYEAVGNKIRDEFSQLGEKVYKFNKSSVEKILLHPFYGGTFEWQGKTYQGKHELFVPMTWVSIAQGKMRGKPNKPMELGIFSQFIKCGVADCGCQIIYDPKVKVNRSAGTERTYHYYHCTDGKGVHKNNGLAQVNVQESVMWEQFEQAVKEFSISAILAKDITIYVSEREREMHEESRQGYFEIKERLEALAKKQDQLYEDMSRGLIDEEDYKRMRSKLKEEIQQCRLKLENNFEKAQDLVRDRMKFALELAKDAENRWIESTPSDRVVVLKNVLSNFYLEGSTIRYDLKKTFRIIAQIKNRATFDKWCPARDLNPHASRR